MSCMPHATFHFQPTKMCAIARKLPIIVSDLTLLVDAAPDEGFEVDEEVADTEPDALDLISQFPLKLFFKASG